MNDMQRAVRSNATSSGTSPGTEHVEGTGQLDAVVTCLWIITPLAAACSVASVAIAILTNQWLHTDEKMKNPAYNGTGERDYLSKLTVSGLWTLCYTNRKFLTLKI